MSVLSILTLMDSPTKLPQLLNTLTDSFLQNSNPMPLGRWTATHHLHRSTPETLDDKTPPSYHHTLFLSQHAGKSFAYVAPPSSSQTIPTTGPATNSQDTQQTVSDTTQQSVATSTDSQSQQNEKKPEVKALVTPLSGPIITVPAAQAEHVHVVLNTKMGALWMPRAAHHVVGSAYEIGDMVVRLGEVRQAGSGQGALRAVIVGVEVRETGNGAALTNGDRNENADGEDQRRRFETAREMARELHGAMGLTDEEGPRKSAKEVLGPCEEGGEIRLWCEALRIRG